MATDFFRRDEALSGGADAHPELLPSPFPDATSMPRSKDLPGDETNTGAASSSSPVPHVREALLGAKDLCDKIDNASEFFYLAGFVSDLVDLAFAELATRDGYSAMCHGTEYDR